MKNEHCQIIGQDIIFYDDQVRKEQISHARKELENYLDLYEFE